MYWQLWDRQPATGKWKAGQQFKAEKKEKERFLGGMVKMGTLAWQLNVRFDKLVAKTRHQISQHNN